MNHQNGRVMLLGNLNWLAGGIGAALLLLCSAGGRAQSNAAQAAGGDAKQIVSPAPKSSSSTATKSEPTQKSQNAEFNFAVAKAEALASSQKASEKTDSHTKTIRIWDACDPESFNAAVGPGTCQAGHHGQTQFQDFFGELLLDQIAGGWRFNPLLNTTAGTLKLVRLEVDPGDRLSLQNVGGEVHTFTKVEEFGGGFFAPLNGNTGNPQPAPECARILPDGSLAPQPETDTNQFVEAGTTELGPFAGTHVLPLGVTHWQCCVHPWMRMDIKVRDHEHEHDEDNSHGDQPKP
jgi:hypothetical protein